LCLRLADFLRELVSRGLRLLRARLDDLALGLELTEPCHVKRARRTRSQAPFDLFRRLAQELDVDHLSLRVVSPFARSSASFSAFFSSSPRPVGRYQLTRGIPSGR